MTLWVDGRLDGMRNTNVVPGACEAPLWLGGDPLHGPTARPFAGHIDELRIWDGPRSAEQLALTRSRSSSGDEPGLLLHWALDEGKGARAKDSSPAGRHGTLGTGLKDDPQAPRWAPDTPFR